MPNTLTTEEQEQYAEEHINLVYHFAYKYHNLPLDYDDRVGEAMIGFAIALKTFDKSKGIKFGTYASRCIITELNKRIEKDKAQKRGSSSETVSLDKPGEDNMSLHEVIPSPERSVILKEVYTTLNEVIAEMNERNQKIMHLYFSSYSQTEISKMLGCTPQNVSLVVNNAYKSVKKRYWRDENICP